MSFSAAVLLALIGALVGAGLCWRVLSRRHAAELAAASTQSGNALQALRDQLDWYSKSLSFAGIGSWEWTAAKDSWKWSEQLFRMRGFSSDKDIPDGRMFYARVHHDDAAELLWRELACAGGNAPLRAEYRFFLPSGEMRWMREAGDVLRDANGEPVRMMGVVIDITEEKRKIEQVSHLANHDHLTGLPNRAFFMRQLDIFIDASRANGQGVALAFVDLVGFKQVNDFHGHATGDRVLQEIAQRLRQAARTGDVVCRVGGDEFVILFAADGQDHAAVDGIVRRIASSAFVPIEFDGGPRVEVGASIGISIYPTLAATPETLVATADSAMYRAKAQGGLLSIATYSPDEN